MQRSVRCCTSLVAILWTLAAGCADSTGSGAPGVWQIDFGFLPSQAVHAVLVLPDTIAAGRPAAIVVNTAGSSTCVRPAGVEIEGAGTSLQMLTPRDSIAVGAQACTDDLAAHPHPVTLTFTQPGEAVVRVRGYVVGSDQIRRLGTVEAHVVVRQ